MIRVILAATVFVIAGTAWAEPTPVPSHVHIDDLTSYYTWETQDGTLVATTQTLSMGCDAATMDAMKFAPRSFVDILGLFGSSECTQDNTCPCWITVTTQKVPLLQRVPYPYAFVESKTLACSPTETVTGRKFCDDTAITTETQKVTDIFAWLEDMCQSLDVSTQTTPRVAMLTSISGDFTTDDFCYGHRNDDDDCTDRFHESRYSMRIASESCHTYWDVEPVFSCDMNSRRLHFDDERRTGRASYYFVMLHAIETSFGEWYKHQATFHQALSEITQQTQALRDVATFFEDHDPAKYDATQQLLQQMKGVETWIEAYQA